MAAMTAMSLLSLIGTKKQRYYRPEAQMEIGKGMCKNGVFISIREKKSRLGFGIVKATKDGFKEEEEEKGFVLNAKNVDLVLEDVRPYLISDGGNVQVVSVEHGVISLKLEGACESCPSSTTTMSMGIQRVLKEKFGDALKDIRQVHDQPLKDTTVEAVNDHLHFLRPAIKNYGGSVDVLSIDGADCLVNYVGPESIGSGIKAAIKERFPDISNVIFTTQ